MTRQGTRRLDFRCSEQGKLPAAKALRLAERDKHMSEQAKPSFMQELDLWTEATIIGPVFQVASEPASEDKAVAKVVETVKRAIRQKVLESYRAGQQAGPKQGKGGRHGS
jgi:hypothetical protein